MLRELRGQRAILVTGSHSEKRINSKERVREHLAQTGMTIRVLANMSTMPATAKIHNGAKAMREFKPDWIVALGGGSTINAAKLMWILYEHPWLRLESLYETEHFPELRSKARFAALATTSGTAAETTSQCILYGAPGQSGRWLNDYALTPDLAIIDPNLAEEMPFALTAYTAMDGLCHALEALMSTEASMYTDALAQEAAKHFFRNVEAAFLGDIRAREQLHYAQSLAGIAFSNAGGSLVHAITLRIETLLGAYHISHGCINAVLLPHVMRLNRGHFRKAFIELALQLGFDTAGDIAQSLAQRIEELCMHMAIPASLAALGVPEQPYCKSVSDIAVQIAQGEENKRSVYTATDEEIKSILLRAYNGEKNN